MSANTKFTFTTNDSEEQGPEHEWTDATIDEGVFAVPDQIVNTEQWLTFGREYDSEKGKYKKKPHATEVSDGKYGKYVQWAGIRSPEQFVTYSDAYQFTRKVNKSDEIDTELEGMAFVIRESDDYVFVDLDDCLDDEGHAKQFANKFLGSLDTFFEVSTSGTGLHAILEAPEGLDDDYQNRNDDLGVEIYNKGRFVAFTGNSVEGKPNEVTECGDTLRELQRKYLDERQESGEDVDVDFDVDDDNSDGPTDDEVVRTAKEYDPDFEKLYNGSNHVDDNDGANESDLAFCNKLSFWAKGDASQIERIWKKSPRSRQKLERDDYVQDTIRTAIRSNPDDFTGNYR
jgi:putative DNA primase/helicase